MSLCKSKLDAVSSKRCNNVYYFINGDNNKESDNLKNRCFIIKKCSILMHINNNNNNNNNSDMNIILLVHFAVLCRRIQ